MLFCDRLRVFSTSKPLHEMTDDDYVAFAIAWKTLHPTTHATASRPTTNSPIPVSRPIMRPPPPVPRPALILTSTSHASPNTYQSYIKSDI
jgi:hypothetical protein